MKNFLAFFFLVIFSSNAFAVSSREEQEAIRNQDNVIQRQQQFQQEQMRQEEIEEIQKEQKKIESEKIIIEEKDLQNLPAPRCFQVNKITFSPNKLISRRQEKKLIKNYEGKCLAIDQIAQLAKEITNYLVAKGYVTSKAEIPPQGLSKGVLYINIVEAALEEILLNKESFFDKTQKFTAFGIVEEGEVLDLRKAEQGLEQMNRLGSNKAVIKIIPGSKKKSSIIKVENRPQGRFQPMAYIDNNGSKVTGKKRETVGFSFDNLLQLNDSFSLSRTANSLDQSREERGNKSINSVFSVPLSWYTLTLSYTQSSYYFWSGSTSRFKSSGRTSTRSATLERVLFRDKKFKLASNIGLVSKYNRSFLGDEKIEVSSKKASTASIGLLGTFFFDNATLFLKPSYNKSLEILDAQKDSPDLSSNSVHAQFEILKFYGNYGQKFRINKTPVLYVLSLDSQISKQTLYSVDQFYVGGVYTVRGFGEGSISGDSGYLFKNELTANLGQMILPYTNSDRLLKSAKYLNYFSLTPFYDYGYVRAKGGQESGRLSGTGIKLGFNHKNLNAALSFSWALSKSHLLDSDYKENRSVYFTINSRFGFL